MSEQDKFERTLVSLSEAALDDSELIATAAMINDLTSVRWHSIRYGDPISVDGPEVYFVRFVAGTERREDWEHVYFSEYWRGG